MACADSPNACVQAHAPTDMSDQQNTTAHGPNALWPAQGPSNSSPSAANTTSTVAQRFPGLRQLYSGAASWRASLRGKKPKSTTTDASVSSRPVIVRTYSGGTPSRPGSTSTSRRRPADASSSSSVAQAQMPGRPSTTATTTTTTPTPSLPPAADFSFDGILHAVEPEIAGAIDAIAAICARSKLSLADEYAAHRPPHEILDSAIPLPPDSSSSSHHQRPPRWWSVVRDSALSAVPEASSSSERLVGSRTASRASISSGAGHSSPRGRKNSAYGSLKSIVSGDSTARKGLAALFGAPDDDGVVVAGEYYDPPSSPSAFHHAAHWLVSDSSLMLSAGPAARAASPRISLATSEEPVGTRAAAALNGSAAVQRQRSSSRSRWVPWPGQEPLPPEPGREAAPDGGTAAEQRLKELLRTTAPPNESRKPVGDAG